MARTYLSILLIHITLFFLLPGSLTAQAVTFEETKKLASLDAAINDQFSNSWAISSDTIVIGTRFDDDKGTDSGSSYVFERNQGGLDNWGQVKKLSAFDGVATDEFGISVSISGDTIVVGARRDDDGGIDSGSVCVFECNQGGSNIWGQVTKLIASHAAVADEFGGSVSISNDIIVAGARNNDDSGTSSGSAYLFERNRGGSDNWGEVLKIIASDAAAGDEFGESVAVSGETVVIGAVFDDDAGNGSGSAYIFECIQGGTDNWGQLVKLNSSDAASQDQFGISVAIILDTVVVGANQDEDAGDSSGSAYVFERDHTGLDNWGEVAKLTASDAEILDRFGSVLAIGGDLVAIVSAGKDGAAANSGWAYVFERNEGGVGVGNWSETAQLVASDAAAQDQFGSAVASSMGAVVVGVRNDDDACPTDPTCNSGSAYVFSTAQEVTSPTLTITSNIPTPSNLAVNVPIIFISNGQDIPATTFSVDFDETCLDFDPTDANSDGIPDAIAFSVPAALTQSVTFSAADSLGELDFTLADLSTPLTSLPDGPIATITFMPLCSTPGTSIIAPINFGPMPAASFGDTSGQSVAGITVNGSVEILPGTPGDCNDDGVIDAGDISACVLEVFDGDGHVWTDVAGGNFLGNPVGCDANQDFLVDAGDFSCKILVIFEGSGACGPAPLQAIGTQGQQGSDPPELRIGMAFSAEAGQEVTIPVSFKGNGHGITAGAFSLDYDESCLAFNPTDSDENGIPDSIFFTLPAGTNPSVSFNADATAGELEVLFLDPTLPFATLPDGKVAELTFTTQCDPDGSKIIEAAVHFGDGSALSFGSTIGQSVSGAHLDGGVTILGPFFEDSFESGDLTPWSRFSP